MRWMSLGVVVAGLGVVAVPAAAEACSCGWPSPPRWPEEGATGVPTNTAIWLWPHDVGWDFEMSADANIQLIQATWTLAGADGVALPYDVRVGHNAEVEILPWAVVIEPLTDLAPGETYTFGVPGQPDPLRSFQTGDQPDDTPPPVPEVERVKKRYTPDDGISCSFLGVSIEVKDTGEPGLLVATREPGPFTDDAFDVAWSALGYTDTFLMVGGLGCGVGWPDADFGESSPLRIGRFDMAGNFSGWTDEMTIKAPQRPGCSVAPGTESGWVFFLVPFGAAARRRGPAGPRDGSHR